MTKLLTLSCVLVACSAPALSTTVSAISLNAQGCYNPSDFGATLGADARPSIQAAVDAACAAGGGRVCIGPGQWTVVPPRFAALSIACAGVEITGAGKTSTALVLRGDQLGAGISVISLDPGASAITISDLTIDTSRAWNTGEQTHAISIGSGTCPLETAPDGTRSCRRGGVSDVTIERVAINHPYVPRPDGTQTRKGDCIKIAGVTPETAVRSVTISTSTFKRCARSAIAYQRNVFDLTIVNNQFWPDESDQQIDGEPTGTGEVSRLIISGNNFGDDGRSQADFAVSVMGLADSPHSLVVVSDNIFAGRGLILYRVRDAVISGNVIDATMRSAYGVINVEHVAERLIVANNSVRRRGVDGALIRIWPHSGGAATNLHLSDNVLTNDTAGSGIQMEGVSQITVADNDLTWSVPAPNAVAISIRNTIRPAESVRIAGNRIYGLLAVGIRLSALPYPFGDVSVTDNLITGAVTKIGAP